MVRGNGILTARASSVQSVLDRAERGSAGTAELTATAAQLEADAAQIRAGTAGGDAERMEKLAGVLRELEG
jgi:hypothetical protein